ncbi:uncharacterized protein IWZ02DRAFT_463312 [Phyllosticta citriasiana]|uniref:uncharacterized protein n=1 Tax=Phyllosticta citriasiana TaxID=595635 RepID=UPI0030FDC268
MSQMAGVRHVISNFASPVFKPCPLLLLQLTTSLNPITLQLLAQNVALRLINHAPRLHVPIRATTANRPRSRARPAAPAARGRRGRRDGARHQDCRARRARRAPGSRAQGPENVDAAAEDGSVGAARPRPPGSLRKLAAAAAAPCRRQPPLCFFGQRALLSGQACFVDSSRGFFFVVVVVLFPGCEVLLAFLRKRGTTFPTKKKSPLGKPGFEKKRRPGLAASALGQRAVGQSHGSNKTTSLLCPSNNKSTHYTCQRVLVPGLARSRQTCYRRLSPRLDRQPATSLRLHSGYPSRISPILCPRVTGWLSCLDHTSAVALHDRLVYCKSHDYDRLPARRHVCSGVTRGGTALLKCENAEMHLEHHHCTFSHPAVSWSHYKAIRRAEALMIARPGHIYFDSSSL